MASLRACLEYGLSLVRRHETKARFLMVGTINTAFGLAAYPVLYVLLRSLELHYLTVLAISQALCITVAFATNKFLVFRTSGKYFQEYTKFITFHLGFFLVNLGVLPLLVEVAGMDPLWAQPLFAIAVIITSYFWHSRITFSRQREVG